MAGDDDLNDPDDLNDLSDLSDSINRTDLIHLIDLNVSIAAYGHTQHRRSRMPTALTLRHQEMKHGTQSALSRGRAAQ